AARAALTDVRMAPFGAGGRLLQVLNSPFCSQCPAALVEALERSLDQIPDNCHLLLTSSNKPDARLKSTRLLKQRAHVESFQRPAVWDSGGQRQMVHRVVQAAGLRIDDPGEQALADAVGSDSGRLVQELEKLSLYCGDQPIDAQAVALLVSTSSQTSLQVGDALAAGEIPRALQLLDELLAANEPPLRILAGLAAGSGWCCSTRAASGMRRPLPLPPASATPGGCTCCASRPGAAAPSCSLPFCASYWTWSGPSSWADHPGMLSGTRCCLWRATCHERRGGTCISDGANAVLLAEPRQWLPGTAAVGTAHSKLWERIIVCWRSVDHGASGAEIRWYLRGLRGADP
ncbi:MAG: DNA polymerase III subunit delta, partial [Aphanocapsa feldmannii 277cI]